MEGDRADQLLRRAQQLREQLQADVKPITSSLPAPKLVTAVGAFARNVPPDTTIQLSNRAAAELELILAEDPMCTGRSVEKPSSPDVEPEVSTQVTLPIPPQEVPKLSVSPSGSKLPDFDGVHLKLETLELTALGKQKLKDVESVWLRCRIALGLGIKGDLNAEEILIRCPEINGHRVALQHSSHQQKLESAEWREVAAQPLQLGLLVGSKEKTKTRASQSKGSQALSPVAEAELLWFAALLEPGKVCPLTADLIAIEPTGTKGSLGRLHFSMELTESSGGASPADASEIYLRVWLDTLETDLETARAILKLGPSQEVAVPVEQHGGVGRLCHCAISLSPVWKAKAGTCVTGPTPPCIFVQIWQGPELCGLAKLVLSELTSEALKNIELQGYEKVSEDAVDVLAVTSDRSIGKLHVLLHAGLEPMLQALASAPSLEAQKVDVAAGMMSLCCQGDILEKITEVTFPSPEKRKNCSSHGSETSMKRELLAMLQACQVSLSSEEVNSLTVWLDGLDADGSTWEVLKSRIQAVHQSFDELIKEVGDECTSVALDFLDIAAPSMLQREDIVRVLKFRGIELGWNTLEQIFSALGCANRSDVLPASTFTRLFRSRAERRMMDVAVLRQLEAKVLAWWRWRDDDPHDPKLTQNGREKPGTPEIPINHQQKALDLVSAYSKSDGTIDLMGLKVLLASMKGPFQQDEVERLAQWLFERFGARPGGGVPKQLIVHWLSGTDAPNQDLWKASPSECNSEAAVDPKLMAPAPKVPPEQLKDLPVDPDLTRCHDSDKLLNLRENQQTSIRTPSKQEIHEIHPVGSVHSHHSQATIQLSKPLHRCDSERLKEVFSASLRIPPHQIKVLGAEEGASRICIVIQGDQSTCEGGMKRLAFQLKDPSSRLWSVL